MGVVPENENTREGILKIMQDLHKLVPRNSANGGRLYNIANVTGTIEVNVDT